MKGKFLDVQELPKLKSSERCLKLGAIGPTIGMVTSRSAPRLQGRGYSHFELSLTQAPAYGLRESNSPLRPPSTTQGVRNPKANITRKTVRLLGFILRAGGAVVASAGFTLYTRSYECGPARTALSPPSCYFISPTFR